MADGSIRKKLERIERGGGQRCGSQGLAHTLTKGDVVKGRVKIHTTTVGAPTANIPLRVEKERPQPMAQPNNDKQNGGRNPRGVAERSTEAEAKSN